MVNEPGSIPSIIKRQCAFGNCCDLYRYLGSCSGSRGVLVPITTDQKQFVVSSDRRSAWFRYLAPHRRATYS